MWQAYGCFKCTASTLLFSSWQMWGVGMGCFNPDLQKVFEKGDEVGAKCVWTAFFLSVCGQDFFVLVLAV